MPATGSKDALRKFSCDRLGELGKGRGGGIGEGGAEAFDGLEGLVLVDDDRGDVLVGLLQRLERLKAAIGKQQVAGGAIVGHVGRGRLPCAVM